MNEHTKDYSYAPLEDYLSAGLLTVELLAGKVTLEEALVVAHTQGFLPDFE